MSKKMDKKKTGRTNSPAQFGKRIMAVLMTAALLFGSSSVQNLTAQAADTDTKKTGLDNTYALQVSTGVISASGNLADEILYFKITYEDKDGYVRSHRIFPGESALKESMSWANDNGDKGVDGTVTSIRSGGTASSRESYYTKTGAMVEQTNEAFESYATDTFFFQPLKQVKKIKSVEILMCDSQTEEGKATSGTWNCQALRVYQVSAVHGVGLYGYVSDRQFASFDGTLVAEMEESKTFNWDSDRMFRITEDGKDGKLVAANESYSTATQDHILRFDIADIYGGGIEAAANKTQQTLLTAGYEECLAAAIRYQDIYGATREAYVPLVTSAAAYALEKGVSGSEPISGLAQEGDTLAVAATLPDMDSIKSIRLIYGSEAATDVTGVKLLSDVAAEGDTKQDDGTEEGTPNRTVLSEAKATEAGEDVDLLSIAGVSIYDAKDTTVTMSVTNTMLRVSFEGSPESYYRASSVSGTTIRPVAKGDSGTELNLQAYETGAKLLPDDSSERYLVVLHTDSSDLAGTTGDLVVTLNYTDISGKALTSDAINVSDAVTEYYGYWPGVADGFAYRIGAKSGGTLAFVVSLKDVQEFTGTHILVRGMDDWQMSSLEIYKLQSLGGRKADWGVYTDGTETTDRMYSRDYTGDKLLGVNQTILVSGGGDPVAVEFNEDNTTVIDTDTGDWSEYRYSMSYETAQSLGRFAKERCNYTVSVKVGDDQTTGDSDGDCGSKNLFFFQLVFEDGKSAYVLANQQLASDGFRSGYTENFTISTNRDMGELTAVKILPDDTSDSSDSFDKLKISSISVQKQTTEAISRQWMISSVGWIDINYQDDAADSSSTGYAGRSESDLVRTYQVEASTYAVNLEFAITTGIYNASTNNGTVDPQFQGQVYAVVEYYNSNGVLKSESFNLVEEMYSYSGQERKTGKSETVGQYTWPGGTESDPDLMFRAGKTDRFTVAIEDITQLLRITLEVRSKVATTWNIDNVYVSYVGNSGRRIINTENEYQWVYTNEVKGVCCSTNSGSKAYSMQLPLNQVQTTTIEFTPNDIEWADTAQKLVTSVTSRQPISADDTLNVYVYTTESAESTALDDVTMLAGAQYSRVYGGFSRVESKLTLGKSNGRVIFYTTGVSASGIDTLNKLDLLAYFNNLNATGQVQVDYAIVQQVRSGVVIGTFYIYYGGCDAAADSNGVSRSPETQSVLTNQFEQEVTLAFADDMATMRLTPETDDVGVSLIYTTTNDVSGREYESSLIYLTDQEWSEIKAGKVVTLTFHEAYVKEITGIRIKGTGPTTRSGVEVKNALVTTYELDSVSGENYYTGSFSFANAVRLVTGKSNQIMERTDSSSDGRGTVSRLTLTFTVPETKDVPAAANNPLGAVSMTVSYRNVNGVNKEFTIYDLCKNAAESNASFKPGNTVTLELLLADVDEIRWISLSPTNEAGNEASLTLSSVSAVLENGGTSTSTQCSLSDWSGSGIISLFGSVSLKLSATTKSSDGTTENFTVDSGKTAQKLVESGQEVVITPELFGSNEGYLYTVEKFRGSYTSAAADVVKREGNTLRFCADNEYTSGSGSEVYYRVTVSSAEIPSVKTVIEFVVEPKAKDSSAATGQ